MLTPMNIIIVISQCPPFPELSPRFHALLNQACWSQGSQEQGPYAERRDSCVRLSGLCGSAFSDQRRGAPSLRVQEGVRATLGRKRAQHWDCSARYGEQLEIHDSPTVCIMAPGQHRVTAHGKLRELRTQH